MRKFLLVAFFIGILQPCLIAQFASSKMTINLKSGKLKLGKKDVSKDWKLNSFTAVLDTNARKKLGSNKIHTYDLLGLILFEPAPQKLPSGIISEFQIILDQVEASNILPKEYYEGKIAIEKADIDRNTNIADIRKKLSGYLEKGTDEEGKFRFSKDGVYIYFIYNSLKKLSKITIGKEKQS
jgi:hypothetical protein